MFNNLAFGNGGPTLWEWFMNQPLTTSHRWWSAPPARKIETRTPARVGVIIGFCLGFPSCPLETVFLRTPSRNFRRHPIASFCSQHHFWMQKAKKTWHTQPPWPIPSNPQNEPSEPPPRWQWKLSSENGRKRLRLGATGGVFLFDTWDLSKEMSQKNPGRNKRGIFSHPRILV
jgi:hypothetical protein